MVSSYWLTDQCTQSGLIVLADSPVQCTRGDNVYNTISPELSVLSMVSSIWLTVVRRVGVKGLRAQELIRVKSEASCAGQTKLLKVETSTWPPPQSLDNLSNTWVSHYHTPYLSDIRNKVDGDKLE
ncbi:hypothetical protein RRG08_033040 [Elysia crispata]|uniref:Uncharacterized protein n=1 Tax=Elysia crispata TaxID=231223 RepID=A0AAE1DTJ0_9GAST|nr:hypothetical protein RRG08_033040 [Elysia crispata]